jgi:dolichol-phosphate mannosyltransferase
MVINDGSSPKHHHIFREIEKRPHCKVIHHQSNKGKGAALKTGIKAILAENSNLLGCITVDADGQHLPEDIVHVAEVFEKDSQALVLGCRDFSSEDVPPKNKMGNVITRTIYKLFTNKSVSDTQTGLRAIPLNMMKLFQDLPGEHYEFEMNMLFQAAKEDMPMKEVAIQTVYIDQNRTSHFKPFMDSIRIYKEILKFSLSSIVSAVVDIGLFALIFNLLSANAISWALFGATSIARLVSSTINFILNKKVVFEDKDSTLTQATEYYLLCIFQMLLSWLILKGLTSLNDEHVVLLKIMTDLFLFFVSFFIQRTFIFKRHTYHEKIA